jgi:hypothetical protein
MLISKCHQGLRGNNEAELSGYFEIWYLEKPSAEII